MRDVDEFLADAEDVIAAWEGSDDSAGWAADGSHQPEQIHGDYYAQDDPRFATGGLIAAGGRLWFGPIGSPMPLMIPPIAIVGTSAVRAAAADDEQRSRAAVLNVTLDASAFVREIRRTAAGLLGLPVPPRRKTMSGMTARKYRAARRAYRRELDEHRRGTGCRSQHGLGGR